MNKYIGISKPLNVVRGRNANLDAKYGPYDTLNHAIIQLPEAIRKVGLTVGIITIKDEVETINEYWWKEGTSDNHLVKKVWEFKDLSEEEKDELKLYFEDLSPEEKNELKLKFEDLSENDIDELRLTYDLLTFAQKKELELTYDKLTEEQKLEMKLKFEDLTSSDKLELKGAKGDIGDHLTVRKTYQTEALALADKNPIDATTALPLTVGQFVSIVDDGKKNGIYRIGSISGDGTMSLELQGKLGDLSDYAKKGGSTKTLKEVDDKIVQLVNNVTSNYEFINYMPGDLKNISPGVFLLDENILLYNSKTGHRVYLYPQDTIFPKQITIPNLKIISLSTELFNQAAAASYLPEGSLVEKNYGSNLGDFIPIFGRSNDLNIGVFTKYLFGEKYASSETVSTLNKNGKIYSVKEVHHSIPAIDIGEYYLNRTDNELYWKNTYGNVEKVETSIGDVVLVSGIRYVKIADGWEPEKIGGLLQHETTRGVYSYDNGEITRVNPAGWLCGKVDVKKGDIFSIKGQGGSVARLCVLKDANGIDIYVSEPNLVRTSIPLSIICASDGIMYFNYNSSNPHEAYCTSSNIEDKEDKEDIESNTLLIKAIARDESGLDSYDSGDRYFSTTTGRLYENKDGSSVDITDEVIEKDYDLLNEQDKTIYKILNGWIKPKGVISNVSFSPDYTMNDVTDDIVGFTSSYQKAMEEVYAKYDVLATEYPDFVEKIDAAELVGIPYPRYANGILEGDAEYAETPAYKTYMYKFSNYSTAHGHDKNHQKFKIFMIAAAHGIEKYSSIATYLFAKQLCDASTSNYFNLRSAFDVYIVPCLNGYGIYNRTRVNANGVDINRNYPTKRWRLTENNGTTYSGAEKGSEFETQLVVALTDLIKPHIPMDWHNYGGSARQFYAVPISEIGGKISYKALVDMSYAFIKNYPSYFGTKYQLFVETATAIVPTHPVTPAGGATDFWYYERNNHFGATYEVSSGINFLDGVHNPNQNVGGADALSIAEYTIRTIVMKIAEYVSQSDVNAVCNWLG